MSEAERSEELVQVHRARDEWEGNTVVDYLRKNGIEAILQTAPAVPPLDFIENLSGSDKVNGVLVLEHEAKHARELLTEFLSPVNDSQIVENNAVQKLKLDKETIGQLRVALKEERRTFEFLGWIGVAFLGAAVLLWAIWPAWLKLPPSPSLFRWIGVILLAFGAVFAGSWASRRLK